MSVCGNMFFFILFSITFTPSPTHALLQPTAARLIKHTGYGNAAGLLLSRGLLTGGRSEGEAEYSSDSETSDTEEYHQSQPQ